MGADVALRVGTSKRLTPRHRPQTGLVPRGLDGHDHNRGLDLFPVDVAAAVVLEGPPERFHCVMSEVVDLGAGKVVGLADGGHGGDDGALYGLAVVAVELRAELGQRVVGRPPAARPDGSAVVQRRPAHVSP